MHNLTHFCIFVPGINAWIFVVRLSEPVNETTDLILQQTNLNQIQSYKIASLSLSFCFCLSVCLSLSPTTNKVTSRFSQKAKTLYPFPPAAFRFSASFPLTFDHDWFVLLVF